jgi:hypothetical protein
MVAWFLLLYFFKHINVRGTFDRLLQNDFGFDDEQKTKKIDN